jgi:hypothetical protein
VSIEAAVHAAECLLFNGLMVHIEQLLALAQQCIVLCAVVGDTGQQQRQQFGTFQRENVYICGLCTAEMNNYYYSSTEAAEANAAAYCTHNVQLQCAAERREQQ